MDGGCDGGFIPAMFNSGLASVWTHLSDSDLAEWERLQNFICVLFRLKDNKNPAGGIS